MSRPETSTIPLLEPRLDGNERAYVDACLRSGWVSSAGPWVERLEREVAARVGVAHAVATQSGTAALHLALRLAGVGPGDEVLVSSLSFIAPANAIRYLGAVPRFVDAEPAYAQLDPARMAAFLEQACERVDGGVVQRRSRRRVRAIVPVHVLGHPVDLEPVLELARRFGLWVVEDAAEALGARYRGRPVGGFGQLGCLSFNGNKTVTAAGGGMIVTADAELARRARYLSTQARDDAEEFVHHQIGYNYRLSSVQAALGCAQLERLDALLAAKRRIHAHYRKALADVPGLEVLGEAPWARSSFWLCSVRVDAEQFGMDRRALQQRLRARGIETRPLWQPLHASPAHADAPPSACPVAERLQREVLNLPSSAGLGASELERVVDAIRAAAGC